MKKILTGVLFTSLAFFSANAEALNITPATVPQWTTNQTDAINDLAELNLDFGTSFSGITMQYKQDVGGPESGPLAASYQTTFSNSPTDPADALIDYISGTALSCGNAATPCLLIVKDGNETPAQYLFNLTALGWNGTEDLVLTGFWPNNGAISHVELWGVVTTSTTTTSPSTVPEPGILALLAGGLGLTAQRLRRRKKA